MLFAQFFGVANGALSAAEPLWTTSNPGFSVHALCAHQNKIWASGASESIAVSEDGGNHWQLKHRNEKGGLLLTLNFVNQRFGYAAGSGGIVLFTRDGGETWTAHRVIEGTILQAAFGDEQHGVIRTLRALLSTVDGGKSWRPVRPANDPDWSEKFKYTIDLAAIDASHLAARVGEGPLSDGEYLWTVDGGSVWSANYVPNTGIHDLLVKEGAYWSIGHEVLGKDKPGGGYGQAMSFRSRDGIAWEHLPLVNSACKSESCAGCTPQGCFASPTTLVDLHDTGDHLAQFPPRVALSAQWARSGNKLCMLNERSIECATIQPVSRIEPAGNAPEVVDVMVPPISSADKPGQRCIRCELPPMFTTDTGKSGPVAVEIVVSVNAGGEIDEVKVAGDLPKDVKARIVEVVRAWLFEPEMQNGIAISSHFSLRRKILVMNPKRLPGGHFN